MLNVYVGIDLFWSFVSFPTKNILLAEFKCPIFF